MIDQAHTLTIAKLAAGLRNKDFSSVELTQHFLKRIETLGQSLNSFITITPDIALAAAKDADARIAAGNATPTTGIPFAQKDIFCTRGIKTSCGSKMLDNFTPPYDATTHEKFMQSGMVLLGKTNMDEFAMGSSNEHSYYGPTKNPWGLNKTPGGSSGGSAAAVAARLTPAATGTDTGGSIRQPAALCGITGLKPTYGRVSRFGMIAFASSLDQGGLLATNAEDIAILLNVMAGFDPKDSTSVQEPVPDYTQTLSQSLHGLKIGLPTEYFSAELDTRVAEIVLAGAKELEKMGATLHDVSLPRTHFAIPTYYVIAPAECSANLARYDGVRFGYRCENPNDLRDLYERSRAEAFGEEVKRRIMIGTYVLSAGYYHAYYRKAQQMRRVISNDCQQAFKQVDVILGPTTPTPAFDFGSKADRISMYLSDLYTVTTNLAGLPGISMPAGFQEGLPIGMQLIGNYFEEARLLNIAHQFQQATDWHNKLPGGFE